MGHKPDGKKFGWKVSPSGRGRLKKEESGLLINVGEALTRILEQIDFYPVYLLLVMWNSP